MMRRMRWRLRFAIFITRSFETESLLCRIGPIGPVKPHDWRNIMIPHKLTLCLLLIIFPQVIVVAQKTKAPAGGRLAIVVDERLAALRATPQLDGRLVRRLSRGRMVSVRSTRTGADGITF